nr:YhjD/YihY/BrkB family envelope integrity protein [Novosphingobium resinovorum]
MLVGAVGIARAAVILRFGPNPAYVKSRWLTLGSIFAPCSWMFLTFGFGLYVADFSNYDATYGSLGAAMVLLTWLYFSAYVLLLGAELNCELERQTSSDTPLGESSR